MAYLRVCGSILQPCEQIKRRFSLKFLLVIPFFEWERQDGTDQLEFDLHGPFCVLLGAPRRSQALPGGYLKKIQTMIWANTLHAVETKIKKAGTNNPSHDTVSIFF